jgi:hypothetical protein
MHMAEAARKALADRDVDRSRLDPDLDSNPEKF